jgi:hypothetical protein
MYLICNDYLGENRLIELVLALFRTSCAEIVESWRVSGRANTLSITSIHSSLSDSVCADKLYIRSGVVKANEKPWSFTPADTPIRMLYPSNASPIIF